MKLLFFFLIPMLTFSQTTFSDGDIKAASGNAYEWLLIGVPAWQAAGEIQDFTYTKTRWEAKASKCGAGCHSYVVANDPVGDQRSRKLVFKVYFDVKGPGHDNQITTKIIFTGDLQWMIQFFTGFWSNTLNFTDIKSGDVVSTRFLTDIATFSFTPQGEPMITVEKAK